MRTSAKKIIRPASLAEALEALTRSLSFQVQMIMWEDRKCGKSGTQGLATGIAAGVKHPRSLI